MSSLAINQIGLYITKSGDIPNSAYNAPIVVPTSATIIKFLVSANGGDILVQSDDGKNYFYTLLPGRELQITIRDPSQAKILSSGVDWQGNARETDVTDLRWLGE